jgi:hypothetical protein
MAPEATMNDLFELAIGLEQAAEALYQGLSAKFAHVPEVAEFWKEYAVEEAGHARWLVHIQRDLGEDKLSLPADPSLIGRARRLLGVSVVKQLAEVRNLEDAYQLANELENSETSTVFEFFIDSFSERQDTQSFLRAQLQHHVEKLMREFPQRYTGRASRLSVKALA